MFFYFFLLLLLLFRNVSEYLVKLIKYRFNKKPFVFIDAINSPGNADNNWIWSMNNNTVV